MGGYVDDMHVGHCKERLCDQVRCVGSESTSRICCALHTADAAGQARDAGESFGVAVEQVELLRHSLRGKAFVAAADLTVLTIRIHP
jgi:hypothetical protein